MPSPYTLSMRLKGLASKKSLRVPFMSIPTILWFSNPQTLKNTENLNPNHENPEKEVSWL